MGQAVAAALSWVVMDAASEAVLETALVDGVWRGVVTVGVLWFLVSLVGL